MREEEIRELEKLLAEDDFARDLALGLSPQRVTEMNRLRDMNPWQDERYSNGDIGNGYLFADFYRETARFVSERMCWYVYDGKAWRVDLGGLRAMELCKQLALLLLLLAWEITDTSQRDSCLKRVTRWHTRRTRETILKDASGVYCLKMADFDRDPFLFNCLNGTLNLHTHQFREHRATDLLTMLSGVEYDPQAKCERWETFVREVMGTAETGDLVRDADAAADAWEKGVYLQKALGYALTGDTRFECLFILYGATTRNGKGTAMETFLRLMGDYGRTARPETIGAKFQMNGNAPSEDVARLTGARFVNISEPDKKLTLSAALVKSLTGNDTITARFLHENSFEYRPQFKMFVNTNYLPQITDLTLFTSGRVKTIPFNRHFEENEQDRGLKELFARPEHLSGILNWCIEGLGMLEKEGLAEPDVVRAATSEYEHNSDKLALFMEECLETMPQALTRTSEVYRCYQAWCQENGFHAENTRNFKGLLASRATIERRRAAYGAEKTTVLVGYRIRKETSNAYP